MIKIFIWMIGFVFAASPITHKIEIVGMKYIPTTVNAKLNDTVIWFNKDLFPHTALNSKSIQSNSSYKLVLKKKGTFTYKCHFHPVMKGSLIVE